MHGAAYEIDNPANTDLKQLLWPSGNRATDDQVENLVSPKESPSRAGPFATAEYSRIGYRTWSNEILTVGLSGLEPLTSALSGRPSAACATTTHRGEHPEHMAECRAASSLSRT